MSIGLGELIITKVARKKKPITTDPSMIKVAMEVLWITIEILSSDMVGGTAMPAMASLPSVQVVASVLLAMIKLLAIEVKGETTSKGGGDKGAVTSMLALPVVAFPPGVLPIMVGDSNTSQP